MSLSLPRKFKKPFDFVGLGSIAFRQSIEHDSASPQLLNPLNVPDDPLS